MRVAVVQSNYIPWKGYFDLIGLADHFVIYDDVQYTKNDWRNRNRIKTPQGPAWLTIPVAHSGRSKQRIDEVVQSDDRWRSKHWRSIVQNYSKASFFDDYASELENLYLGDQPVYLSEINESFLRFICRSLGITTTISRSTAFQLAGDRTGRLVEICRALDADVYLSGPAARSYLDETAFRQAGVAVEYMDYDRYPEYRQLHPPFEHAVSAIDLLFSLGAAAPSAMKFAAVARR